VEQRRSSLIFRRDSWPDLRRRTISSCYHVGPTGNLAADLDSQTICCAAGVHGAAGSSLPVPDATSYALAVSAIFWRKKTDLSVTVLVPRR
jgi:hypothetical protein